MSGAARYAARQSAHGGVAAAHGATIERSRFFASGVAVAAGPGVTTVKSSVMYVFGSPGVGLLAQPLPGSGDVTINADGITIVSPGPFNQRAAFVRTYWAPTQNADINLKNSILRGAKLEAEAAGTGHARISVSYSGLNPNLNDVHGAPNASIDLSNVGDAGFADRRLPRHSFAVRARARRDAGLRTRCPRHPLPLHAERGGARCGQNPARASGPSLGWPLRRTLGAAAAGQALYAVRQRRDAAAKRDEGRKQHPVHRQDRHGGRSGRAATAPRSPRPTRPETAPRSAVPPSSPHRAEPHPPRQPADLRALFGESSLEQPVAWPRSRTAATL
jgi:hypothetical protein